MGLAARPASGYGLSSWSGRCSGNGECAFFLNSSVTVGASFVALPPAAAPYVPEPAQEPVIWPSVDTALEESEEGGEEDYSEETSDEYSSIDDSEFTGAPGDGVTGFGTTSTPSTIGNISVFLHNGGLNLDVTDLEIPGRGFNYKFTRSYKSQLNYNGVLGYNWNHNYNTRLQQETPGSSTSNIFVVDGAQRRDRYVRNGDGTYTSPPGYYNRLAKISDRFELRDPDGTKYNFRDFDASTAAGTLQSIVDRNGNTMRFVYDGGGRLTTVVDTLGREIQYGYDPNGRLTTVTDFMNRVVRFTYDGNGDLVAVTSPAVTGTSNGNDFPSGKITKYTYSSGFADANLNHNLISITRPNEEALTPDGPPYLTIAYGEDSANTLTLDRVLRRDVGGVNASASARGFGPAGGRYSYFYETLNPGADPNNLTIPRSKTTIVDPNGNVTAVENNVNGNAIKTEVFTGRVDPMNPVLPPTGPLRSSDPTSYVTTATYTANGLKLTETFPAGNTVEYTYDVNNPIRFQQANLLKERRLPGLRGGDQTFWETTYTYEPIFNQLRTVTTARGNDSAFTPPLADNPSNVTPIDFNLDGDNNDPVDGETTRRFRYTTLNLYDYQEGSSAAIQSLATTEGVSLTASQATALSLNTDWNGDGLTNQLHGNLIEERRPTVTLEDGTAQLIITTFTYNNYGQLTSKADPAGNLETMAYFPATDPNGDGLTNEFPGGTPPAGADPSTGGYKRRVIHDHDPTLASPITNAGTSRRSRTAEYVNAKESYTYDRVGNVTSVTDGRGITTTYEINSLNQLIRETTGVVGASFNENGEEPNNVLSSLNYERVLFYDANDNLIQEDVENNDENNQSVIANPFLTTTKEYDILDKQIAEVREVSNGEVGPTESITTLYAYDKNQNRVLTVSPVATLPGGNPERQPNNITATVFDERNLLFKESRGGIDAVFIALHASGKAHENIDITQFSTTSSTATSTKNYDGNKNLITSIDAEDNGQANAEGGDVTTNTYDGNDRLIRVVDAMGYESESHYDPENNRIQTLQFGPVGSNTRGVPGDRVVNKRLSESNTDEDELNRPFRARQAYFRTPGPTNDPQVSEYVTHSHFNRNSKLFRTIEPDGDMNETHYDGLDRVVITLDQPLPKSGGGTVQNERSTIYDDNGNVIQIVEVERSPTTAPDETYTRVSLYDAVNRKIRETDNLGNTTRTKYDSRGNAVFTSDARGPLVLDTVSNVNYRFPFSSTPVGFTDINSDGNSVTKVYDGLNRLVRGIYDLREGGIGGAALDLSNPHNPDGKVQVDYDFDPNSRVVSRTDDDDPLDATARSTTTYVYDDLNRLVTERFADDTTYQYVYDRDDHVTQITDPNGSVRSSPATTGYDDLGRKIDEEVTTFGSGVSGIHNNHWQFDGLSRVTFSNNSDGSPEDDDAYVTSTYDSLSRLTSQTQNLNADPARTVTYEYNQDGRLIQLTYPDGRKITRGFDGLDRVTLIEEGPGTGTGNLIVPDSDPANDIATFNYMGPTRPLAQNYVSTNGVSLALTYDGDRRPIRYHHDRSGTVVVDLRYAYNRTGDRLYEQFSHEGDQQADIFAYDSLSRLTQSSFHVPGLSSEFTAIVNNQLANPAITTYTERQKSWTLDGAQNWRSVGDQPAGGSLTTTTLAPNAVNAYTTVGASARTYDANGNLKDDGTRTYTYDVHNRIVRIEDKSDSSKFAKYVYDTENRRVFRNVQGLGGVNETRLYFYNRWSVIEERDGAGQLKAQYVDGLGDDHHLQTKQDLSGNGAFESNETFFYHQNPLQHVEAITDASGVVAERYDYDAYGSAVVSTTTPTGNRYRFTGQRSDPESGLLYFKNRYYEPSTGRFLQRDPEGMWQDSVNYGNGYTYVGNNPQNNTDTLGLKSKKPRKGYGRVRRPSRRRSYRRRPTFRTIQTVSSYAWQPPRRRYGEVLTASPTGYTSQLLTEEQMGYVGYAGYYASYGLVGVGALSVAGLGGYGLYALATSNPALVYGLGLAAQIAIGSTSRHLIKAAEWAQKAATTPMIQQTISRLK
ncbi:MAG: hypothetical protein HY590_04405 [Candidatus Omnitrophica bacterium]|nr:hypothetical protein [Candidatus Omnitrophota bacterium]